MANDVNIDFSVSVIDQGKPPMDGNLQYNYKAQSQLPSGVSLKDSGTIDIEHAAKTPFMITFNMATTRIKQGANTYELQFVAPAEGDHSGDSRELLWITKFGSSPKRAWDGEGGFYSFKANVDGTTSSMSVMVDRSKLDKGWYDYGLAFHLQKANTNGFGYYARNDPQIKNGSPREFSEISMIAVFVGGIIYGLLWLYDGRKNRKTVSK